MGSVTAWVGGATAAVLVALAATVAAVVAALPAALVPPDGCPGAVWCQDAPPPVNPAGWVRPVPGPLVSGFRTRARPGHDGVDLGSPRGTTVRAASAGVVVTVLCNVAGRSRPPDGRPAPCDRDGNPGLGGCGWYVQVRHAAGLVTRYCHLLRAPLVRIGQAVAAGQPLGVVGTSGNSSGPHLHFEVHVGHPAYEGNAVDPVPFLAARGIQL